MRQAVEVPIRVVLLAIIWVILWRAYEAPLSAAVDPFVILGGVLPVFPLVWLGRKVLDRHPTMAWARWTTTFVHCFLGFFLGIPLLRALSTHAAWPGPALSVPTAVGQALAIVTGAVTSLTVLNLALKGLGAPFFIVLSKRLAADWLYARTRNPMAVSVLAFFACLGIWYQSALFVLWVLVVFAPALLFFIKVFEERELEIRFGAPYLEYRAKTPMLFPRMRKG